MNKLLNYLDKIPKAAIPLVGIMQAIMLGWIDHITGYEISFSIFYLLPVTFVAWFGKGDHAIFLSVISAAIWMWADLQSGHAYSHVVIPVWNAIMRLGFFLLGTFSLAAIKTLLEKEQTLARVDSLTGAANSRAFHEMANIEIDRMVRFSRPLTIAYIDIDNFKTVNDSMGHTRGDVLLQSVAKTVRGAIRSMDIFARLGGDEFAVLFPETDEVNAKKAVSKVQTELIGIVRKNNWPVTFSIGAVTCVSPRTIDELIREADQAMYAVKASGKNGIAYKTHAVPGRRHAE